MLEQIEQLATAGFYLAIRVGFAFPSREINQLPDAWVSAYTRHRLIMHDPALIWAYESEGTVRFSDLTDDPKDVLGQAAAYGLRHGAVASHIGGEDDCYRSFGIFARPDREFTDDELVLLYRHVRRLHNEYTPPTNITKAELEALRAVRSGKRLKEIAQDLGITEGAVKQRLRSARDKLGATTTTHAVSLAEKHGLI